MTSEPPLNMPHLPGHAEDEYSDFTHRKFAPRHEPNPSKKGIPYNEFYTPQKLGSLLFKVAAKKLAIGNRRASKGKLPAGKGTVTHGRK